MNPTYRPLMIAAAAVCFSLLNYSSFADSTNPLIGTWVLKETLIYR